MIMLSDLWRTEEDRMTSINTNTSTDRKRAFANDSNTSTESSGIHFNGRPSELRRIQCKARLLSTAGHDIDNAFFEIPLDAPHGMEMTCSHPKCAASGRRFRYCRVCEVPVAKRNFPIRHGHRGQIRSLVPKKAQVIIGDRACDTLCTSSEHSDCKSNHHSNGTEQSSHASLDTQPSLAPQSPTHVPLDHNHDPSGGKRFAGLGNGSPPTAFLLGMEQQEWLGVLHARSEIHVGDEVKTAVWLDRVLAFTSDEKPASPPDLPVTRPFDPRGSMSSKCPTQSEESGIRALLIVRGASTYAPDGEDTEPKMQQQQPNLWHASSEWTAGTSLYDQESPLLPEPVEAIVSRSKQESAKAASELEEIIAFIYNFEKDQFSKSQPTIYGRN